MKHETCTYPPFLSTRSLNTRPARHKATSDHRITHCCVFRPAVVLLPAALPRLSNRPPKKSVCRLCLVLLLAAWRRTATLLECRDLVHRPLPTDARAHGQSASPTFLIVCLGQASCFFCCLRWTRGTDSRALRPPSFFADGIDKARCHDVGHVVSNDIPCFWHDKSLGRRETYTPVLRLPELPPRSSALHAIIVNRT